MTGDWKLNETKWPSGLWPPGRQVRTLWRSRYWRKIYYKFLVF